MKDNNRNRIKVSASILTADFANLTSVIKALEKAGTDIIHLDVMDGHFVPNLTFGPNVIKSLRPLTKLRFDAHLMVMQPENSVNDYIKAGADMIIVHPESTIHLDRLLNHIKTHHIKAGIALNPTTSLSSLEYVLDKIDLVLIMTVNPGFGGQEFINSQIDKIKQLKAIIKAAGKDTKIEIAVDGGINDTNAAECIKAGANTLVAGGFILHGKLNEVQKINPQLSKQHELLKNAKNFDQLVKLYEQQITALKTFTV